MSGVQRTGLLLIWAAVAIAAATAAYWGAGRLGDAAPLGTPLPEVPVRYEIIPHEQLMETSVVKGRLAEVLLEVLAAQPDGAPPLHRTPATIDIVDFKIWHPYATTIATFSPGEVNSNGVLAQADLLYDQALRKLMYSMPSRPEGESVTEYMARTRYELDQAGARFHADVSPLALDGYRFEHFEYDEELETGEQLSHFVYIGPLGPKRVLRMDFVTAPELHEGARAWVVKIMNSFKAGSRLQEAALTYDASYLALNKLDA